MTAFDRAAADSAPATDVVTRQASRPRAAADSAPAVDTHTHTLSAFRTVDDDAPATDDATRTSSFDNQVLIGDNGTLSVDVSDGPVYLLIDPAPVFPGLLTITCDTLGGTVEVLDGEVVEELDLVGTATDVETVTDLVVSTGSIYLRVYGSVSPVSVTWERTDRAGELEFQLLTTEIASTPGVLLASVANVDPDSEIIFDIETYNSSEVLIHTDLAVETLEVDTTGQLVAFTILIEGPYLAGSFILIARNATARAEMGFTVLADPDTRPDPAPVVTPPTYTPPPVAKWVVLDGPPDFDEVFSFPYNPSEKSTPHAPRTFSVMHTTAPDGQHITFEGAITAHEFTANGYLDTQDHYEALETFVASQRRWWLVDNRSRGWLVSFEAFDPAHRRRVDDANDWSFDYTLTMLIYAGPEYFT